MGYDLEGNSYFELPNPMGMPVSPSRVASHRPLLPYRNKDDY